VRVGVSAVGTEGTASVRRTSRNVRVAVGVRADGTVAPSATNVCVGVSMVPSPTVRVGVCAVGMTVGTVTVSPSSSQGVVGDGTSVGTGISVGDSGRPEDKSMSLLSKTEAEIGRAESVFSTALLGGGNCTTGDVGEGRSVGTGTSLGDRGAELDIKVEAETKGAEATSSSTCAAGNGPRITSGRAGDVGDGMSVGTRIPSLGVAVPGMADDIGAERKRLEG